MFKRGARRQSEPSRGASKSMEKPLSDDEELRPGVALEADHFNFLHDQTFAQLDPEILELCQELEELGGGIKTRIQPI